MSTMMKPVNELTETVSSELSSIGVDMYTTGQIQILQVIGAGTYGMVEMVRITSKPSK